MKANHFRAPAACADRRCLGCGATAAFADIKDYEFKLVDPTVTTGPDKIITVQLVNKTTGKPVPDAVIFATRLDMAPDGMAGDGDQDRPAPGDRAGHATASRPPSAWPALAAVARRQGAGRDRHGRKQARHHRPTNEPRRPGRNRRRRHVIAAAGRRLSRRRSHLAERTDASTHDRRRRRAQDRRRCRSTIRTRTASRSIR